MSIWPTQRILLIEHQSLFTPFLVRILEENGATVSLSGPRPTRERLRRIEPDVVCIDLDQLMVPPFVALKALRQALPEARIVAYASAAEPVWAAVAKSLGATVVLGPQSGVPDLLEAVRPPLVV